MRTTKPVFLVTLGVAAISYVGCQREAIGNPKFPPDCGVPGVCPPDAAVDAPTDAPADAITDATTDADHE